MRTDELRIEASGPAPANGGQGDSHGGNGGGASGHAGADRFWGEFSRTRAGRSNPGAAGNGSGPKRQEAAAECLDWCPICRSADLIRGGAPPDLIGQLEAIQGEALNVMKAFLAAYSDRTEGRQAGDSKEHRAGGERDPVDIPID